MRDIFRKRAQADAAASQKKRNFIAKTDALKNSLEFMIAVGAAAENF